MNLVLFGAPGSGKGTQSALLIERMGYTQISTGDLLRKAVANLTQLGQSAKSYMDKGDLVPDELVIDMVREVIGSNPKISFIFDGFPRTEAQAISLESMLAEFKTGIHKAIFLQVPNSELMSRLTGRRVCQKCGAVFHVRNKPSSKDGVCDICGGRLIQRKDDFADVIERRLVAYEEMTLPLKDFFQKKGILSVLDGTGETEVVFSGLKTILS